LYLYYFSFILANYPQLSEQNLTSIAELYAVPETVSNGYADSDGLKSPFSKRPLRATLFSQIPTGPDIKAWLLVAETSVD
jgi:hypothetical protein